MAAHAVPSNRADARRNRDRLVEVARRMMVEASEGTGSDIVPLESIARAAGVGIGTLYRHFPNREALVAAVYHAELDRLAAGAADLLPGRPAAIALRLWMDRFAEYVATKRHLGTALRALVDTGVVTRVQARSRLSGAVELLLEAGGADGTLRTDVVAEDVVASLLGIFLACPQPEQQEQVGRMTDLLLDGLTPRRCGESGRIHTAPRGLAAPPS